MMRSVRENTTLVILRAFSRLHFVNRKKETAVVDDLVQRLQIKTPTTEQEVGKLSGGNQQKVVLARWLARSPDVLVLDEPTRGVDVGAKTEIYKLIQELAASGMAVLFISSELPEVLGVSDRIIVMQDGAIIGEVSAKARRKNLFCVSLWQAISAMDKEGKLAKQSKTKKQSNHFVKWLRAIDPQIWGW